MNLKEKYAYYLLEKKARKIGRDVKLSGFNEATVVGVIWHINDLDAYRHLIEFLRSKKVKFRGICYSDKNKVNITNSFGKKEVNFWGFPQSEAVNQFMATEYDLLMNISVSGSFPLEVLAVLARAHFKIGWASGNVNIYDLTIDISKNINSSYLVEQQILYIEQFNKKA